MPEQAWQLDAWGPAGQARVHMAERPRVDPNQVRQLHPGEAFLIQGGRAVKLSVLQAPVPAQVQEEASALRAAAMSAAEPVYVAEGIVGAPPQVELWRPNQPALDQPDQPTPMPALEAPSEDGHGRPSRRQAPALPALPRQRILLALRQAIAAARPGHGRRRHPGRPARGTRLGPHRRAGPAARRRSLATLAAPAQLPAVPGPGRPPGAGAPWLTRPWLRDAGWPAT